ncbi:MAG: outer membrane beta-barrel protein [Bacteroidota bacterium]|nr:outer membrane beta-barrel protein [Bacteroidota bacterium]
MIRINCRILIALLVFCAFTVNAQKEGGQFSLGVRNTTSLFTDAGSPGTGFGGQFRIRLGKRVNTDWFTDYLTTDLNGLGYRRDGHIGWSVLFYLGKNPLQSKKFSPFVAAGHCFDYTKVYSLIDAQYKDRWSSAVQLGLGTHYNLSERFDATLMAQYMNHLGSDLHSHIKDENGVKHLEIEKHEGFGLEGHILLTLSLNYRLGNLWGR